MAQMTLVVEGPEIVIDLLKRAVDESQKVLVVPETIAPGYIVDVVH